MADTIKRTGCHQLLGASSLLCKLQSHHTTSGTQGIDGMLTSVSQATAARDKSKWSQRKEIGLLMDFNS